MKIINMLAIPGLLSLAACQRSDDVTPDANKVAIVITNPTEGQTFHRGDTVFMNAAVQYVSELHGYELTITNVANNAVLFDEDDHVHDDHFTISNYWVDTLSQPADLKINLTAEIDHNGNEADKSILIKTQP